MQPIKSIAKNLSILSFAHILNKILSFFFIVYVARILGPKNFGIFAFASAFTAIFSIISNFGMDTIIKRDVSANRSKAQRYFSNYLSMKLLLSFLSLFILINIASIINYESLKFWIIIIMGLLIIPNSFDNTLVGLFQAHEEMKYQALSLICENILKILIGIVLLYLGYGLLGLIIAIAIGVLFRFFIDLNFVLKRYVQIKLQIDRTFWKYIFRQSIPLVIASAFTLIYVRIDVVMLSFFKGDEIVGYYSLAYRLLEPFLIIPTIVLTASFPVLSRLYVSSKISFEKLTHKLLDFLLLLSIPIATIITIFAKEIMLLLYGEAFINSAIALQILIWSIVLIFSSQVFVNRIIVIKKQKLIALMSGISVLINIGFNLILIPKYSYIGASIATLITELFVFLFLFYFTIKYMHKVTLINNLPKLALSGVIYALLLYYFRGYNWLIVIPFGMLTYLVSLILVKFFTKEDLLMIKGIFTKV